MGHRGSAPRMPNRTPGIPGAISTRPNEPKDNHLAGPRQRKFTARPAQSPFTTPAWHYGRVILPSLRIAAMPLHNFFEFFTFFSRSGGMGRGAPGPFDIHPNTRGSPPGVRPRGESVAMGKMAVLGTDRAAASDRRADGRFIDVAARRFPAIGAAKRGQPSQTSPNHGDPYERRRITSRRRGRDSGVAGPVHPAAALHAWRARDSARTGLGADDRALVGEGVERLDRQGHWPVRQPGDG